MRCPLNGGRFHSDCSNRRLSLCSLLSWLFSKVEVDTVVRSAAEGFATVNRLRQHRPLSLCSSLSWPFSKVDVFAPRLWYWKDRAKQKSFLISKIYALNQRTAPAAYCWATPTAMPRNGLIRLISKLLLLLAQANGSLR
jgi:hypothetical protein